MGRVVLWEMCSVSAAGMEREPTEAMLLDLEEVRSLRKVVGDVILGICVSYSRKVCVRGVEVAICTN